jgi:hypothetical protein
VGRLGGPRSYVRFPHGTEERHLWRRILEATKTEWRAAYEGRPTRLSMSLAEAQDALDAPWEGLYGGVDLPRVAVAPAPVPRSAPSAKMAPGFEAQPFAGRSKVAA